MKFSYYFDYDKTHVLNMEFAILQFTEKESGSLEITFSARISEVIDGITKKSENITNTFVFQAPAEGEEGVHDIDFQRVRYADQKKWVFHVRNNKNTAQEVIVGLISDTANQNPLGLDITHDSEEFKTELRANNLSILETGYVSPVISQTIVNAKFDSPGFPNGFSSYTSSYNDALKYFTVSDFKQDYLEAIPAETSFKIELDIVPETLEPVSGAELFQIKVDEIGVISVQKDQMTFTETDTNVSANIMFPSYLDPASMKTGSVFSPQAKMKIEGDGKGVLKISYGGSVITASYQKDASSSFIEHNGVSSVIDNILVKYYK